MFRIPSSLLCSSLAAAVRVAIGFVHDHCVFVFICIVVLVHTGVPKDRLEWEEELSGAGVHQRHTDRFHRPTRLVGR